MSECAKQKARREHSILLKGFRKSTCPALYFFPLEAYSMAPCTPGAGLAVP